MSNAAEDARHIRRRRTAKRLSLAVRYVVLTVIGLTMILPFVWMLSTSLKTKDAAVELPPRWVPRRWATYADVDGKEALARILKTTSLVKRRDNGATVEVYTQAIHAEKPWWQFWAPATVTANIRRADGTIEKAVPVEVASSTTMVRLLEAGPRYNEIADLAPDKVVTKSHISFEWANYPETWRKLPFGRSYINTALISVTITAGQLLTCSLAAFAFARLRFPGRDQLFLGYLATMMIPGAVTLIPVYILFVKMPELLNWTFHTEWFKADLYFMGKVYMGRLMGGNSYFAMIAPGLFSAYGTFMLRQFFMNLPRDLEDAARIDGCGNLRVYAHVTLPLSKVALATLGTFVFMGTWKSFMWPLIIINREELLPLQVLLQRFQGQYGAEYTLLMAGSMIVLAPLLVVFLFGQKYFVKGIQLGGIKG
jgi:multiple sugar transport system permease protein